MLEPGESYVSVILPSGDGVRRVDIAAAEWTGPEANTVGWWRSEMPRAGSQKLRPAPNGVLIDTLSELLDSPGKEALAYLLALLLVRRRVLHEERMLDMSESQSSNDIWQLACPADGRNWSVPIVELPPARLPELQAELNTLLFTEE